ncbi:MAG: PA14 domain-containing protein, partial [Planctomycetota bacterium]
MPPMDMTCAGCGSTLKAERDLTGKVVRCRKCGTEQIAADAGPASAGDGSPPEAPSRPRKARQGRRRGPLALIAVPAIVVLGGVLYAWRYRGPVSQTPASRTPGTSRRVEYPATSSTPDAPAAGVDALNRQLAGIIASGAVGQETVAWVERMPRLPEPLVMRDWPEVARKYYRTILDRDRSVEDRPFFVVRPRKREPLPVPSRYVRTAGGDPGWKAEYFNNREFEGAPVLVRTDAEIDFDWGDGSPAPEVKADRFSARWTARLAPEETATYTFAVDADDGARVTVDGRPILENLGGPFRGSAGIDLRRGRTYAVVVDYVEQSGEARMRLGWDYLPPGSAERDMVD